MDLADSRHETGYSGCGIYALVNLRKGKVYIGKSANIRERFTKHKSHFNAKAKKIEMYSDNIDDFAFIVLEKLSEDIYKQFGSIYELAYMKKSLQYGNVLYNKHPKGIREIENKMISDFLLHLNIGSTFKNIILEETGTLPWNIFNAKTNLIKDEHVEKYKNIVDQ